MNSNPFPSRKFLAKLFSGILIFAAGAVAIPLRAQETNPIPVLQIKADQAAGRVSPILYGLMTEEINYSYEGGLYGELIRNRTFKASTERPVYWQLVTNKNSTATMSLDPDQPLNDALATSLKLDVSKASRKQPAGISNSGYWGIPVRPKTTYQASFYARAKKNSGPLTVAIQSDDGKIFASATVRKISKQWKKYEVTLKTGDVEISKDNRFVILTGKKGTIWFQQVSLFPPTYNNRPNGNRIDIMQLLAAMQPKFLRFPGGNYLEGNTIATRFNWKETIGDISQRPGHRDDAWGYWSTDGMGLLEFLDWCEDLHMQPVLAVYAGYSLRQQHVPPGANLQPFVQDALDEIEYVTGGTGTKWGAMRAKDGHPAPFKLSYVEIGNEDWFDRSGTYDARFAQFYDAVKAKYPNLQIIATARVKSRTPDLIDEHFYRNAMEMESDTHHYDHTDRNGPKIFVGEWATREGSPTPNMKGALGDAAWMTGMERNSDLVLMSSYAPLFININPGGMQWRTDLIGYNALNSYGSPSFYAQKMFNLNRGDTILATASENIPTRDWQPPARRRRGGGQQSAPPAQHVPTLFFDATRDSGNGMIYLKIVNVAGAKQPVRVQISGVNKIEPDAQAVTLKASSPNDTNSIQDPKNIIPVTTTVSGLSADFTQNFPPYSITVLRIKGN
ncbi:MAG: alpha-L-arabinofuranosidase C-terminal domain-containing protein [Limisphaerales bacterium]